MTTLQRSFIEGLMPLVSPEITGEFINIVIAFVDDEISWREAAFRLADIITEEEVVSS